MSSQLSNKEEAVSPRATGSGEPRVPDAAFQDDAEELALAESDLAMG